MSQVSKWDSQHGLAGHVGEWVKRTQSVVKIFSYLEISRGRLWLGGILESPLNKIPNTACQDFIRNKEGYQSWIKSGSWKLS